MKLKEIEEKLQKVCDIYAEKFKIKRNEDWFLLKLQDEVGELVSAHLKLTERARIDGLTPADLEKNFQDEIADVLAMTILFARYKSIDSEKSIREKWFQYLPEV